MLLLRRLLLLLLLQVLRELSLLQRLLQVRLAMRLSLGLRSCLRCSLGLSSCISDLKEGSGLSIRVLTVLSCCQILCLLLLEQSSLLLSDVKSEIAEASHAELVRIDALSRG